MLNDDEKKIVKKFLFGSYDANENSSFVFPDAMELDQIRNAKLWILPCDKAPGVKVKLALELPGRELLQYGDNILAFRLRAEPEGEPEEVIYINDNPDEPGKPAVEYLKTLVTKLNIPHELYAGKK